MTTQAIAGSRTGRGNSKALPDSQMGFWPLTGLCALLAIQFSMVFTRAINWDEYSYWREVAFFADGRLDRPLQTFHVRLFEPLAGLFHTSTDHIVAARIAMFGFELATLWLLYFTACRFTTRQNALFVPLAYLSAGYVLQHGFSFRVDPIVTTALIAALCIFVRSRLDWKGILGLAICAGFAAMITIKAVLYLPIFAGAAVWRLLEAKRGPSELLRMAAAATAAGAVFGLLFWLHSQGLSTAVTAVDRSGSQFESSSNWIFFVGIPPYWPMILKSLLLAPLLAIMIALAPIVLARVDLPLSHKAFFAGAWLPLLTLLFYKNTAAYYYVFLFAPLALASVPVIRLARSRYGDRLVAIAFTVIALGVFAIEDRSTIDRQRQVEANVQEVFGSPVTYFDHNYMLGGWPKANAFMTPWNMERYRQASQTAYRAAMLEQPVPLLLGNSEELRALMEGEDDSLLLPEDTAALRRNYISFSWPIWIAGKHFGTGDSVAAEEFLVPGPYTVRGGPVTIDGVAHGEDDIVTISRGLHSIQADGATTLIWGERLRRPARPLQPGPIDVGF